MKTGIIISIAPDGKVVPIGKERPYNEAEKQFEEMRPKAPKKEKSVDRVLLVETGRARLLKPLPYKVDTEETVPLPEPAKAAKPDKATKHRPDQKAGARIETAKK